MNPSQYYQTIHSLQLCHLTLNDNLAHRLGRALADFLEASRVIVGGQNLENRGPLLSSIRQQFINGLTEQGANVIDIGHSSVHQVCTQAQHFNADSSVVFTGTKYIDSLDISDLLFFNSRGIPIDELNGLNTIVSLTQQHLFDAAPVPGEAISLANISTSAN